MTLGSIVENRIDQLMMLIGICDEQIHSEDVRPEIKDRNKYIRKGYTAELVRLLSKFN
jgi:hypothetical protein